MMQSWTVGAMMMMTRRRNLQRKEWLPLVRVLTMWMIRGTDLGRVVYRTCSIAQKGQHYKMMVLVLAVIPSMTPGKIHLFYHKRLTMEGRRG